MTREEAIKNVKMFFEGMGISLSNVTKESFNTLIPELAESKDERIIKTLQEYVKNRNWNLNGPTQAEVLAWLEKQKEQKPCEDSGTDGDIMQYIEEGEKRGIKEVISFPEKYGLQKEQKPAEWGEDDEQYLLICKNALYKYQRSDQWDANIISNWLEERLKSHRPPRKQELSKEDRAILDSVIRIITQFDDLAHEPTFAGPKWTHPYTKELNFLEKLRNRLFEEND